MGGVACFVCLLTCQKGGGGGRLEGPWQRWATMMLRNVGATKGQPPQNSIWVSSELDLVSAPPAPSLDSNTPVPAESGPNDPHENFTRNFVPFMNQGNCFFNKQWNQLSSIDGNHGLTLAGGSVHRFTISPLTPHNLFDAEHALLHREHG